MSKVGVSTAAQRRIVGIDVCRSTAIVMVMLSHSLVVGHFYEVRDLERWALLPFFIQFAPPTFIAMFGAMLEVVYQPRAARGEGIKVARRLLTRALQCYLFYVVSLVALWVAKDYSLGFTVRSALLLGVTPFTDILKFYALALLIAPALIQLRIRIGLGWLIAFSLVIQAAYPIISKIPAPPEIFGEDYLGFFAGFLYGAEGGKGVGAPSLLHGMTIVVWGMGIGRAVVMALGEDRAERRKGAIMVGGFFLVAVGFAALMWNWSDPYEPIMSFFTLRNLNHPLYYATGCAGTIAWISVCVLLFDVMGKRWGEGALFIGRTSLFTFSFGNIVLYLAPDIGRGQLETAVYTVTLVVIVCLQSYVFHRLQAANPAKLGARLRAALTAFQTSVAKVNAAVAGVVEQPARGYGFLLGWSKPAVGGGAG